MCITHPLNIPYVVENGHLKVKDGHLTLLACLPHSPQSGLKFGWRNIKSMSVYLASFTFQNLFKKQWKIMYGNRGKHYLLWAQESNFTFFFKVDYYPLLSLAVLAFYFIHFLLLSIVSYYIVYWVQQCSIIWPIGS